MTTLQVQPDDLRARVDQIARSARRIAQMVESVDRELHRVQSGGYLEGNRANQLMARYNKNRAAMQVWPGQLELFADMLHEAADVFTEADQAQNIPYVGKNKYSDNNLTITGTKTIDGWLFGTREGEGRAIHPSDAKQGQLGDCYLVASLAVLAEQDPDWIRQHIRDNGDGTYTVTLYEDGEPVEVTVTAEFPIGQRDDGTTIVPHLAEHGDRQAELWAMLYEKAYATHLGDGDPWQGYLMLNDKKGGSPYYALQTLTGQDSSYYSDANSISIQDLARMESDGQAITLGTLGKDANVKDLDLYRNGDLVQFHAYYVTGVDVDAGTVTIQNPWGWDANNSITISYEDLDENFSGMVINSIR